MFAVIIIITVNHGVCTVGDDNPVGMCHASAGSCPLMKLLHGKMHKFGYCIQ